MGSGRRLGRRRGSADDDLHSRKAILAEFLGVLAVFHRKRLNEEEFRWLRIFADYAAIALTNARALAQIEEFQRKLEAETEYLREEVKAARAARSSAALRPCVRCWIKFHSLAQRTRRC